MKVRLMVENDDGLGVLGLEVKTKEQSTSQVLKCAIAYYESIGAAEAAEISMREYREQRDRDAQARKDAEPAYPMDVPVVATGKLLDQ